MGSLKAGAKVRASQLNITVDRYYSTDTTSTVATGATELILPWAVAEATTPNVTASGTNNTTFTLNKSGYWIATFQTRVTFGVTPSTGDMFAYLYLVAGTVKLAGKTISAPVPLAGLPGAGTIRSFTAGDQVRVRVRNTTNQVMSCSNSSGHLSHIALIWLQGV